MTFSKSVTSADILYAGGAKGSKQGNAESSLMTANVDLQIQVTVLILTSNLFI